MGVEVKDTGVSSECYNVIIFYLYAVWGEGSTMHWSTKDYFNIDSNLIG